jgi:hypothetical protein
MRSAVVSGNGIRCRLASRQFFFAVVRTHRPIDANHTAEKAGRTHSFFGVSITLRKFIPYFSSHLLRSLPCTQKKKSLAVKIKHNLRLTFANSYAQVKLASLSEIKDRGL